MQTIKNVFNKSHPWMLILAAAITFLIVVLLAAYLSVNAALDNPNIFNGIYVGDVALGGLSLDDATDSVTARYGDNLQQTVLLRCQDVEHSISLVELGAEIDLDETVVAAYQIGHKGGFFTRLKDVYMLKENGRVLSPAITCNEEMLTAVLSEMAAAIDEPGKDMELSVGEKEITITKGVPGYMLNCEAAVENFKTAVLTLEDGIFTIEREKMVPTTPDVDAIYNEICGEPKDASYQVENQQLTITESQTGVSFDKEKARLLIEQATGDTIIIPAVITPPALTKEALEASLFTDLLGSYSTHYNAGDVSRSHNLALAAQKINNVVLAPGDVFSYNNTVGPRTIERGFRTANVYVGNKVEPGIGGGICQVSTTLFNAAVLSDLRIVQRANHSLPVSYVPLGRDATVSYGSVDFQFTNSTKNPVKIVASASGGTHAVSIYGVKDNPGRTIEITTQRTGTRAASLVQKEDPSLPAGTVKVEQQGAIGSSYNTYKVIKENGKTVKTELLTKSTYLPSDRIEIVGTGAPSQEEAPENTDSPIEVWNPAAPGPDTNAEPTSAPASTEPTPKPTESPAVVPEQTDVPLQPTSETPAE